jgi:quinol monooxygenase YgiN
MSHIHCALRFEGVTLAGARRAAVVSTTTVGLYVPLEAKPGREADVEAFLKSAVPLVDAEPATTAWFAIRLGPSSFAIFDVFPNEDGRAAHLQGAVAAALMEKAGELFAQPPNIQRVDVLADKIPG